jgi:hypothetical protein
MITFTQYLEEHFINLLPGDEAEKAKHAPEVHAMLQKAYAPIGGIHGSGFNSPEDMVKNIPMWKAYRHEGKIKAIKLYKNNSAGGRKSVAVATDGSPEGKAGLSRMMRDDMQRKRSYGELSGAALSVMKRNLPDITQHVIPIEHVKSLAPNDEIRSPPADDPEILRHPELTKHFYQRIIGNTWHTKLMLGTTGNFITKRS